MIQTHVEESKNRRKSMRAVQREGLSQVRVGINSKGNNDCQPPYYGGGRGKKERQLRLGKLYKHDYFLLPFLKFNWSIMPNTADL